MRGMKLRTVSGLGQVPVPARGPACRWIGAATPCLFCDQPVGPVAVFWCGYGALVGDGGEALSRETRLVLHPRCAVRLAYGLGMAAEDEADAIDR